MPNSHRPLSRQDGPVCVVSGVAVWISCNARDVRCFRCLEIEFYRRLLIAENRTTSFSAGIDCLIQVTTFTFIAGHSSFCNSGRDRPTLRSASSGCIQLPTVQTSVAQRSFAYNKPSMWHSLSATLPDCSVSLHAFKRRLKHTYLQHD